MSAKAVNEDDFYVVQIVEFFDSIFSTGLKSCHLERKLELKLKLCCVFSSLIRSL